MGSTECLVSDGKKPLGSRHNEKHLMAASRWYLNVVVRVPVGVEDDDCVCCGQVDAKTSSSSGEQETKLTGTRSWETRGKNNRHNVRWVLEARGWWRRICAEGMFQMGSLKRIRFHQVLRSIMRKYYHERKKRNTVKTVTFQDSQPSNVNKHSVKSQNKHQRHQTRPSISSFHITRTFKIPRFFLNQNQRLSHLRV